jgi:L-threonylcarbamoyladenylate synthase
MTDPAEIAHAAAALRAGALVGMPTETVYGLAADALDAQAVLRIFVAKGRPRFDPLIVHCADAEQAWTVAVPSPRARLLARQCWPGPLTLILPRRPIVPDVVTSGLATVAVRVPDHPVARELIRACGRPVAAPSANPFGRISPTTAAHVREQLGSQVAVVVDGGPCRIGVESTVLRPDPTPVILRPGGLAQAELARILRQDVAFADERTRADALPREAPGLLASHYAPRCPLRLRQPGEPWIAGPRVGLLAFTGADLPTGPGAGPVEVLSPRADLGEAAAGLFAAMRRLDARALAGIQADLVPDQGLGQAINDRLRRAAGAG